MREFHGYYEGTTHSSLFYIMQIIKGQQHMRGFSSRVNQMED